VEWKEKMNNKKEGHPRQIQFHNLYDILFIGSSIVFNIAVSGVYIASKFDNLVLLQVFGAMVVFLSIPFTISLIGYIKDKAEKKTILSLLIILVYLCLEIVLDYILKTPFREILVVHIPYIIVFYAAAFSMIGVSFRINRKMGFIVLTTFWIVIGCLIYLYLG
jgi:hypothetical protein